MSTQINIHSTNTAKPVVAGVLNLFAGACSLLFAFGLLVAISVPNIFMVGNYLLNVGLLFLIISVLLAIVGILAVIGGVMAIQRKAWNLALAGSIASVFPFFYLGIASVILTAVSRDEFS